MDSYSETIDFIICFPEASKDAPNNLCAVRFCIGLNTVGYSCYDLVIVYTQEFKRVRKLATVDQSLIIFSMISDM